MGADGDCAVVGAHDLTDFFEAFGEVDFEFFSEIVFESFLDDGLILRSVDDYFLCAFGNVGTFELVGFYYDGFGFAEDGCWCAICYLFFLSDFF